MSLLTTNPSPESKKQTKTQTKKFALNYLSVKHALRFCVTQPNAPNVKLCQIMSIYVKLCQKMYQPATKSNPKPKKQPKTNPKKTAANPHTQNNNTSSFSFS
jgi:hypothetical protein